MTLLESYTKQSKIRMRPSSRTSASSLYSPSEGAFFLAGYGNDVRIGIHDIHLAAQDVHERALSVGLARHGVLAQVALLDQSQSHTVQGDGLGTDELPLHRRVPDGGGHVQHGRQVLLNGGGKRARVVRRERGAAPLQLDLVAVLAVGPRVLHQLAEVASLQRFAHEIDARHVRRVARALCSVVAGLDLERAPALDADRVDVFGVDLDALQDVFLGLPVHATPGKDGRPSQALLHHLVQLEVLFGKRRLLLVRDRRKCGRASWACIARGGGGSPASSPTHHRSSSASGVMIHKGHMYVLAKEMDTAQGEPPS
eukprot:350198-Chlamydomonas_euryale.AAC.1